MTDPEVLIGVALKSTGAFVGSIIAILFIPPKTRSEFVRRVAVALGTGVIFAVPAREWLGLTPDYEGLVAGACFAAIVGWWMLGMLQRVLSSWKPK